MKNYSFFIKMLSNVEDSVETIYDFGNIDFENDEDADITAHFIRKSIELDIPNVSNLYCYETETLECQKEKMAVQKINNTKLYNLSKFYTKIFNSKNKTFDEITSEYLIKYFIEIEDYEKVNLIVENT
jgi:hypothetical protein